MQFLEVLVAQGLLKDTQIPEVVRRAEEKYNGDINQALVDFGLPEEKVLQFKSVYYNIPIKDINPKSVSTAMLKYIPEDSAKHYKFVSLGVTDGTTLDVGIVNPDDITATDALQFITAKLGMPFKTFLITSKQFQDILKNYSGVSGEIDQSMSELDNEIAAVNLDDAVKTEINNPQDTLKPGEEEKIVEDAPIIKIVAVILRHAADGNASDIHIENTGDQVKVRFRVDGTLHTSLVLPLNVYAGIVARIKILSKLRLDEKRKPQDGGFSTKINDRKIDFRVSTFPTYYGEKVVMRILDSDRGVKALDSLDMSPKHLEMIRRAINRPYGLILITGPTGSGKSTTLYSMLNELDREKANVVSLEDPVEYHMANVNQSQVMPEIGYTFASGLRSILRQDPDIIMVGEIRDKETAQLAIQAALTGHLVFSTLHTNTAIGAIPRLVDMGIDPYLIAPTLILTMAQRLVKTIYPPAKQTVPMDDVVKKYIEETFADLPETAWSEIKIPETMTTFTPTADCATGLRGRMAVFEALEVDQDIQKMILTNPVEQEIYKVARSKGMTTLREDALLKSLRGDVPLQEVYSL